MSNRSEEPILSGPGDLFRFSLNRCFLTNSGVILMSVSFSSESPLNLAFELVIFSIFSRVFRLSVSLNVYKFWSHNIYYCTFDILSTFVPTCISAR